MKVPPDFGIADAQLTDVTVKNDLRLLKEPEARIMAALHDCGYDEDTIFAIKLAFEEAVTNAVKHGNCNDRSKHVHLRYYVDPQRIVFMVRDEGPGFCPEKVPDPTADENLERPSGRGLMLMQSYMTKVAYSDSGNEVWLLKENTR
ncbi:MAG: ATP-binding protein [Phycisphaerales bacterium]|nr:ATP-binding protein [Phycisphaerales bacterium]